MLLQKKEDELFNADEKIAQLECELDEERNRSTKLRQDLSSVSEEKQSLTKQCQAVAREKIELALKFQVEKSKVSFFVSSELDFFLRDPVNISLVVSSEVND